MTPKLSIFGLILGLSGCCLGTTVSSGTGETTESTLAGGAASSGGGANGSGTASGSGTGGVSTTGTGAATGSGTGTTTGACDTTALTVSPNPINFGYVPPDLTAIGCTTVSNPCGASVSITGVGNFDTNGGQLAVDPTDNFPIAISGGGNAQVCFAFTPPAPEELVTQATLITSEPNDSNPVVQLTGWGGGPEINCKPLFLAFGVVMPGQTSTLSVTCTDVGTNLPGVSLLIGPLDAGGGVFSAAFDASDNPYPDGGLQAGQSVQIDVTYTPVDDSGAFGVLSIPNNGGEKQTPYVSLSGDAPNG